MSKEKGKVNIFRLFAAAVMLLLLFNLSLAAYAAEETGSCGEQLTWSLENGRLTLTGSGEMEDFPEHTMAPWYARREEIRALSLPEGLTSVGDLAFYGCNNLTAVTIPDTVQTIGSYAFAGCAGITMLDLGTGVTQIGTSAFSDCTGLTALVLPEKLESIGEKAFYRCEAIPEITVPKAVCQIGKSAFGYCKSLVCARLEAQLTTVPELLFYGCHRLTSVSLPDTLEQMGEFSFRGCEQLATVSYTGKQLGAETLQTWISKDVPSFEGTGYITAQPLSDHTSAGATRENGDGTITQENTTVLAGENFTAAVITETVRQEDGKGLSASMEIHLTVEGTQGWQDAEQVVLQALESYNANTAQLAQKDEQIQIHLYVKEGKPEMADLIAKRNISMTVSTMDGSRWRLDGQLLSEDCKNGDLRYTLTDGTQELCQKLGAARCYVLRFHSDSELPAEVLLPLGADQAHQTVTLLSSEEPARQLQSSVVDAEGNAHFYLAAIAGEQDYYVAVRLTDTQQEPIIPDELLDSYGRPIRHTPIEYQIIGVKSSLGVSLGQFTGLLIAGLVVCVAAVGVTVYLLYRRKNKQYQNGGKL